MPTKFMFSFTINENIPPFRQSIFVDSMRNFCVYYFFIFLYIPLQLHVSFSDIVLFFALFRSRRASQDVGRVTKDNFPSVR